ncbi:hypothetical protein CJF32_00005860 [Rutstroemia sp. NJR-2017a WRK4]|nr:hypothetical protein CJF32_00005860 [Rutstroemia sp. NJR-2017a WRK4]
MSHPKVLIPMSDYGHDPTETSVPYHAFKSAGFGVHFATENGATPECDRRMLDGITQKLLGATSATVALYNSMSQTPEFKSPVAWSSESFSLSTYDLVFLPGGHEKSVRQLIDSDIMHKHLAAYWKDVKKPGKKAVAAVCHGVMVLSETMLDGEAKKSIIYDCDTTALPGAFEGLAYWGTRWALGDYYKTYGAGSESVETSVSVCTFGRISIVNRRSGRLDDPAKQYKNSLGLSPFVVEDEKYNYVSARFPGDAQLLADTVIKLVQNTTGA